MRIGEVELAPDDLATHVRIMGPSGMGKSTLLYSILTQLVLEDQGFCLLDPHGELYTQLHSFLAYTEYRRNEVTLLDATNREITATINPFRCEPDRVATKAQVLTDMTLQAWGKDSEAVRAEKLIRIAFVALLEQNRPLRDLPQILKKGGVDWRNINDPYARTEWQRLGPSIESVVDAAMTRLGILLHPDLLDLTDPGQAIDVRKLMRNRILLANISRKLIGRRESRTLGAFIVAEIWAMAFEHGRRHRPFWLVLDEFSLLMNPEIASVLKESQKFGLHLLFLHQDESQILSYMRESVDGVSCFIRFLDKGHVAVKGWGSGYNETLIEPEPVPFVHRHELDRYRKIVRIAPIPQPPPELEIPQLPIEPIDSTGRGGQVHIQMQETVKLMANKLGFAAQKEKDNVDVLLKGHGTTIAVEISGGNSAQYEANSAAKNLGKYDHSIVVTEQVKKTEKLVSMGVKVFDYGGLHSFLLSFGKEKAWMTPQEFADERGYHVATVRTWCKEGIVPAQKFGRDWRINRKEISAWKPPDVKLEKKKAARKKRPKDPDGFRGIMGLE